MCNQCLCIIITVSIIHAVVVHHTMQATNKHELFWSKLYFHSVSTAELIKKVAMLKRNCFASVFEKYFDYQVKGSGGEQHAVINYRDDETMYVYIILTV